jgi:hypothetical protein
VALVLVAETLAEVVEEEESFGKTLQLFQELLTL